MMAAKALAWPAVAPGMAVTPGKGRVEHRSFLR